MLEAAGVDGVERPLPRVAEGRVAQIVAQADGLRQVLVEPQGAGHGPGQARHLQGVGQPGAVVIPLWPEENLGFMFETAEGLGVGDAVHIPLEAGADLALRLRDAPPAGILRQHAAGPDDKMLELFSLLTGTGHFFHSFPHINRKKEQGDLFPLTLYTTQKCISLYFF